MAANSATRPREPASRRPSDGLAATKDIPKLGFTVYSAAALSVGAALIHFWVAPEHFLEWWGYGAFFLAAALAQGLYSVALLRWPSQPLFFTGIAGNLAIVLTYIVTHTYGVPLGPHAASAEAPETLGMAATAAELGIIVILSTLLGGAQRRWVINILLLVGAALWASRFFELLP